MSYHLRFFSLLILLLVIPFGSIAEEFQLDEQDASLVLSDSIVALQLARVDSLRRENTNSAYSLIESMSEYVINNSKLRYQFNLKKIRSLSEVGRNDDAINYINNLILIGEESPEFYFLLAREYVENNQFSRSINSSQQAIILFQKENNIKGVVDVVNYLIVTYGYIGMFEEAKNYFNENLKRCNNINYEEGLIKAYQMYGESLAIENPNLSYELLQTSKDLAISMNSDNYSAVSFSLIKYYINNNQLVKAKSGIKAYFQNYGFHENLQNSNAYTFLAHIYSLEKNVDSTIFFNKKALQFRILHGNQNMIASSYLNLAGNYLVKNDIETANEYLDKADITVQESNNPGMLLTFYRGKVKYFEFIEDYNKAYEYSQKEIKLSQEITNQQHQSILSKLNTGFEIQQKNIRLERELESRKTRTRMFIFILSTIILLLIGGYLIYIYRKKNYSYLKLASRTSNIEKRLSISDKERSKFQSIFEYSVTGILILDKNGLIQYSNRKSKALLDKREEPQILSIPFVDFFENNDKVSVQEALLNMFVENKPEKGFKVKIINKNTFHWLDLSFAPLVFEQEDGNILVTLIDVTQEVINIGREQEQKKELQTLLNSVTESILFIQRNGKIKALNSTAASRLDSKSKDLIGANYFDSLPKAVRENRTKIFNKVALNKKPFIELEMIGNHNNIVSMYPNINAAGEVDYISEFVQDITERRVAEEQIDNLKQRVLRSQMNPHFIFNSLTSIQSFIIRNDAGMASKYLNSFARLIRLILESSRRDYISLKSEIDILNYYLDIQKMRFSDNFNFSFDIDPDLDLERIKIPPMLAQPFIENSIEHGIQHLEKMGDLNIKFVKEETHLIIELRDNGIGREASDKMNKENLFASKSLSTQIVNDRLTALNKYAKDIISYSIIDLKDEQNVPTGTQVIISIPISYF